VSSGGNIAAPPLQSCVTMAYGSTLLPLTRRYGLIALMLFVLAGAQVLQATPLHDHSQHSVDCGLWHVPVADAPAAPLLLPPDSQLQSLAPLPAATLLPQGQRPSPYQGRAPPALLS
jgi:hypothetical protein